jgi:hypothetical protein
VKGGKVVILRFAKALAFTMVASTPAWAQLQFVPVTPCRVADTRNAAGPFGGPTLGGGSARSFAVPQSACNIPATAAAYSLNVTVLPEGTLSYLTLWPTGQSQPLVSTLNSFAGDVVANAAIVPAGSGGAVSVFVTNQTDVILDINGYFAASTASNAYAFYPATPCRVADTRNPTGQFGGPSMFGGQSRDFPVPLSACSIPASARGYSLNATVVPGGYLGYLTMWPTGQTQPLVSTLNSWKGKIVANAALVPAGTNESISVFVSNPTDVVLDINGYFGQPGSNGALSFYAVTPCRIADTRNATGPFGGPEMGAATTRSFPIPASGCGIPANAAAYSVNVTVVPDGPLSYLSMWPLGVAQPYVSTLNSVDGRVVANAAIVPAGAGGGVDVYVTNQTHVILDINGYFAAAGGSGGSAPNGYTVTGMVSGLSGGTSVLLKNNNADALTVAANGAFTFPTALASGATYAVTVATQPVGGTCQVANGGPAAITADVTNVTVTCGPTVPPDNLVAERALAQTGLSMGLASSVLESQIELNFNGSKPSLPCDAFTGGGSMDTGSEPTPLAGGTPRYPVTLYYDGNCTKPYIRVQVTGGTDDEGGNAVLTETTSYYSSGGTIIGTMTLTEAITRTYSPGHFFPDVLVNGLGVFTPAGVLHTPVQMGLACNIPSVATTLTCTGGIGQDLPGLGVAIGALTSMTLTSDSKTLTFSGSGSMVTGTMGQLVLTNPSGSSFVFQGGTLYATTTASGSAGALELFPPTPTSWTLTDAAHDQKILISVIDDTSRSSSVTITQVSTGRALATGTVDQSGTGTITYSDRSVAAITSWTLAD